MPFVKGVMPKGSKPFQKGKSGNPGGRPKGIPNLSTILVNVLGKNGKEKQTEAEKILEALKKKALNGDVRAAELLLDRAYGKPKQGIELSNPDGETLRLKVGYGKGD